MTASPDRPSGIRWLVFALLGTASGLLYLHRYAWGVIKPDLKKDYPDLTDTQLGWLDSLFMAAYAIAQIPAGIVGDRLGPRAALAGMFVAGSACVAAFAIAPGILALGVARIVFGVAQAGVYGVINKSTRSWFPARVRTTVQGVITALGRAGGAAASVIIATVLIGTYQLSWESSLVVIAVPGLLLAAALWVILRDSPAEHPWTNAAERQLLPPDPPRPAGRTSLPRLTPGGPLTLTLLMAYACLSTAGDQFFVFWVPTLLEDRGLSKTQMGLMTTLPLLGGAVGGMVGGGLNDWLPRFVGRRWARSLVAFTGKGLGAALVVAVLFAPDGYSAAALLGAAKFFGDWSLPTQWGTITDLGGRSAATLFGVINTAGSVGGFVGGVALGWIKQQYGWEGVLLSVSGVFLAAAVVWLAIDCTRPLTRTEPTPEQQAAG